MGADINHLHHVGLVVDDMTEALALYRRLGFTAEPPAYPLLPQDGGDPQPFGVANTAIRFRRNFVEVVAIPAVDAELPPDAILTPIQVPPEHLGAVTAVIQRMMDELSGRLAKHPGLHRLVFATADADAVAAGLDARGVAHSGVNTTQRPVDTDTGTRLETIRHLEIGTASTPTPEAVLAVAEGESLHMHKRRSHPNGAVDLIEAVVCVDAGQLDEVVSRYRAYLDIPVRVDAGGNVFDLEGSSVIVLTPETLLERLPGEIPPTLPAVVAYAVQVADLAATARWLEGEAVPVLKTNAGELFVPAAAALGAAVIFREG